MVDYNNLISLRLLLIDECWNKFVNHCVHKMQKLEIKQQIYFKMT